MPAAKYKIERKCALCGTSFLAKTIDSIYCSKSCSNKAYNQRIKEKKQQEEKQQRLEAISENRLYISVSEAVVIFGISKDTIHRLIRDGRLCATNLGKRLTRISLASLQDMFPKEEQKDTNINPVKDLNKKLAPEECYTIGEIPERFGVSSKTVYEMIRRYGIPKQQIGKYVYVSKKLIENILGSPK
ncbi:MAG: helix-turn-helix domain-containing protein [Bacteroidia bacterium]|nr:helix-turn-helix domain-containing protein [Bacteroidia bacterium]